MFCERLSAALVSFQGPPVWPKCRWPAVPSYSRPQSAQATARSDSPRRSYKRLTWAGMAWMGARFAWPHIPWFVEKKRRVLEPFWTIQVRDVLGITNCISTQLTYKSWLICQRPNQTILIPLALFISIQIIMYWNQPWSIPNNRLHDHRRSISKIPLRIGHIMNLQSLTDYL